MIDCLVKLGDIALDDDTYIKPGTYQCYFSEKNHKWDDAGGGNHDDVYALKVKGSFTINAPTQDELDFFMDAYRRAKIKPDVMDKRIQMHVFLPTENTTKSIVANATMPKPVVDFIGEEIYYMDIEFEFEEC